MLYVGPDMEFDFDMLISKEAGSEVETPWHQDESYWLDLPDKVWRFQVNYFVKLFFKASSVILVPNGRRDYRERVYVVRFRQP